jgi:hypothetical protein
MPSKRHWICIATPHAPYIAKALLERFTPNCELYKNERMLEKVQSIRPYIAKKYRRFIQLLKLIHLYKKIGHVLDHVNINMMY